MEPIDCEAVVRYLKRRYHRSGGATKYYIDCYAYAENLDKIQIEEIIQNTVDSSVIRGIATDDAIKKMNRHIVIKIGRVRTTIRKECNIGEELFKHHVPGYIRYIRVFPCYETADTNERDVLVMPYIATGSIRKYTWDESNVELLKNLLAQTVLSAAVAYEAIGFIHSDLHLDNILFEKTTQTDIAYKFDGQAVTLKTLEYKIVIMDFGNSYINVDRANANGFFWDDILNALTRVNLELRPSNLRKVLWENDEIIALLKQARKHKLPPSIAEVMQLVHMIHNSTFEFEKMPIAGNLRQEPLRSRPIKDRSNSNSPAPPSLEQCMILYTFDDLKRPL